jgi:serine/threonine protein kinase
MATARNPIESFDFPEGRIIGKKYRVLERIGKGWESEVYKIQELNTKIERAAKVFFPHRNVKNKKAIIYAKQLYRLSSCPIVINYHSQEQFWHRNHLVTALISEFVEGEILSAYVNRHRGKRIGIFSALQILNKLVEGLEHVHRLGEYHGDMHTDNIIVKHYGLGFKIKVLDMYQWGDSKGANKAEDILNCIRVFYDVLGGQKQYQKHPPELKEIILGLRRDLILKKFRTMSQLRQHIENIEWESSHGN